LAFPQVLPFPQKKVIWQNRENVPLSDSCLWQAIAAKNKAPEADAPGAVL
jgi:hypothetical protein